MFEVLPPEDCMRLPNTVEGQVFFSFIIIEESVRTCILSPTVQLWNLFRVLIVCPIVSLVAGSRLCTPAVEKNLSSGRQLMYCIAQLELWAPAHVRKGKVGLLLLLLFHGSGKPGLQRAAPAVPPLELPPTSVFVFVLHEQNAGEEQMCF